MFFGTPSRKFNKNQQIEIIKDINDMLINKVVDYAIVYKEYIEYLSDNIKKIELKNDLILISKNEKIFLLEKIIKKEESFPIEILILSLFTIMFLPLLMIMFDISAETENVFFIIFKE